MIKFNISASSYKLYKESPIQFYYRYIAKEQPDTTTVQCYGLAGNVVHKMLEEYSNGELTLKTLKEEFNKRWIAQKLDKLKGLNRKVLEKGKYFPALLNGIHLINNNYNILNCEEEIILPFYKDDELEINLKGYIDFVAEDNGEIIIGDWKTNSSKKDFSIPAKMYHLLYYKKYGILPIKASYEYLKLFTKPVEYDFTLKQVLDFEQELLEFVSLIKKLGNNESNYEFGDIHGIFNEHYKKCITELTKRIKNGTHIVKKR